MSFLLYLLPFFSKCSVLSWSVSPSQPSTHTSYLPSIHAIRGIWEVLWVSRPLVFQGAL